MTNTSSAPQHTPAETPASTRGYTRLVSRRAGKTTVSRGVEDSAEDKMVLGWTHTARFLTTASELVHLPASELPEIAFVGRSNAGKSTAINTLAQQKRLAFASKTPGRTQHINLFEVGPKDAANAWFADLPGYGYAAVAMVFRWARVE